MKVVDSFSFEEIQGFKFGKSWRGVPKLYSHIYFIDGLLIDTGHRRMANEIIETIKDLPVTKIYITHYHEDHSGNIEMLANHFGAPVLGSKLCSEIMKSPPSISISQKMSWGNRPAYENIQPLSGSITTENHSFRIIDIPGHARDMTALYEPNKKWLFSADLYVNSFIGYFLREESTTQQIDSIKKILALDFDVMLCGHNPAFQGAKVKLQKKLKFLEAFYKDVAAEYAKGKTAVEIFKSLKLKEFWFVRLVSRGALSRLNMVKSVIRDINTHHGIGS